MYFQLEHNFRVIRFQSDPKSEPATAANLDRWKRPGRLPSGEELRPFRETRVSISTSSSNEEVAALSFSIKTIEYLIAPFDLLERIEMS